MNVNGEDVIQLSNYYVVDGNNGNNHADLLNSDYVKVYGTFHYNVGTLEDMYTLHVMDDCTVTITNKISEFFD